MCLISVYFEDADLYAESYLVVNNKIHVSLSVRTCLTNGTHRHSLSFIFLCKKWPSGPPARLRPVGTAPRRVEPTPRRAGILY